MSNYIILSATSQNLLSSTSSWTAQQTFTNKTIFSSPTITIGENAFVFQSSAPAAGDTTLHHSGGRIYFGGDGGSGGSVGNSTFSKTIAVGGEVVYSSATFPFFPGAWWSAPRSSCTITGIQATVQRPSQASAVFPFYVVAQSSWQWSPYGVIAVSTNTRQSIFKTENIVVSSTNSFGIGIASAPVSAPASEVGFNIEYWCSQP